MLSDDLRGFYEATLKDIREELEAIKDNLAFGGLGIPEASSYEYWVGQAVTYRRMQESMKARLRRMEGEMFEKEDE